MMTDDERNLRTLITAGWENHSSGHVEAPTGHFAIVDCAEDRAMLAQVLDITEDDLPAPHYFLVVEDNYGNVHLRMFYTMAAAQDAYAELETAYAEWDDLDD